ncbi:hypothetical protein E4631_24500 [Hymenobacter sp. UV11]|uniref:hypothetical protein n=1 Tax=Hymenobacter sp. UV11 TaxID=1849735 RepID=UPI00105FE104|nr:hypothetical protein [Hymenobacter sp. UV11]TDN35752.1 hypothetical protein A8B98_12590 [Hymenobacter sp. UV11]TFZ62796.1 hypothetical protein E4631_24500 [Hymenobacter sp. UV11]
MVPFAITPLTHLYALRHLLYSLGALAILLPLKGAMGVPVGFVLLALSPYLGPGLYVYVAYYLRNRHTSVAAFEDRLEVTENGAMLVLPYGEMEAVELHAAGGVYRQTDWENFAFQSYHYLKIQCHGQTHFVTSLLTNSPLEKAFPHLLGATAARYTRHKRFLAYLD